MKLISIFLLIVINFFSYGQNSKIFKVSKGDSIHLIKTWAIFNTALIEKNKKMIKAFSLNKVVCTRCIDWSKPRKLDENYSSVSINEFVKAVSFTKVLDLWKLLQHHTFNVRGIKTSKIKSFEIIFPFEIKGYDEGYVHIVKFIKKSGEFKFYGFDTIP